MEKLVEIITKFFATARQSLKSSKEAFHYFTKVSNVLAASQLGITVYTMNMEYCDLFPRLYEVKGPSSEFITGTNADIS